jgi:hypothetical protein
MKLYTLIFLAWLLWVTFKPIARVLNRLPVTRVMQESGFTRLIPPA